MKKPNIGPFFPYYGAKWRASHLYPSPRFGCIVEPFAGAAGYSVRWHDDHFRRQDRVVTLSDSSPHVVSAWQYLIDAATDSSLIESLPDRVRHVDELPERARALVGFWLNPGSAMPKRTPSSRANPDAAIYFAGSVWSAKTKDRLLREVPKIAGWRIVRRDWRMVFDTLTEVPRCTLFVDPPYESAGVHYAGQRWTSQDYADLAEACRRAVALGNQVIVCEGKGASWLPFRELSAFHGSIKESTEVVWMSED